MSNKFKDSVGRWLTLSLFFETTPYNENRDLSSIPYTLKEDDHEFEGFHFKSLKRLYLETADVTEYEFANKYLGGYSHWKALSKAKWFQKYVEEWREELEVMLRSRAIKGIIDASTGETKDALMAAKWVADKKWGDKPTTRSKKKEVDEKINEEVEAHIAILDNYRRENG